MMMYLSALNKIYGVDNADYSRIYGTILVPFRHAGTRTADYYDPFVEASADRINGDQIAALVGTVEIDRFYDQKFLTA
jgi:hypothetical protein